MDGSRLRVHSDINTQGKLFVKFIALIIYMKMSKTMQTTKLFDKLSITEVLLELKKIKKTYINDKIVVMNEITKKQLHILEAFGLNLI
ncbi:MAG: hypothetical protein A2033_07775 [Bacteroidetes bacterium GWA2_31_9]|nr:MAG: hypothetical protein A2033_07775 [Bacteroidetes bacterium GWA2_31_9]